MSRRKGKFRGSFSRKSDDCLCILEYSILSNLKLFYSGGLLTLLCWETVVCVVSERGFQDIALFLCCSTGVLVAGVDIVDILYGEFV